MCHMLKKDFKVLTPQPSSCSPLPAEGEASQAEVQLCKLPKPSKLLSWELWLGVHHQWELPERGDCQDGGGEEGCPGQEEGDNQDEEGQQDEPSQQQQRHEQLIIMKQSSFWSNILFISSCSVCLWFGVIEFRRKGANSQPPVLCLCLKHKMLQKQREVIFDQFSPLQLLAGY